MEWALVANEEEFPLKDPAILRMRLVSDGLSLEMMIVRREKSQVCSSNGKLAQELIPSNID